MIKLRLTDNLVVQNKYLSFMYLGSQSIILEIISGLDSENMLFNVYRLMSKDYIVIHELFCRKNVWRNRDLCFILHLHASNGGIVCVKLWC